MSEKRIRALFEVDDFEGENRKREAFIVGFEQCTLSEEDGEMVESPWVSAMPVFEDLSVIQECVNEYYANQANRRHLS